jgi:hypothetical protein
MWGVTYSEGSGSNEGTTKMLLDVYGNIYISGTRSWDFTTIKYDRNGEIIWAANYDGWASKVDICNDMAIDDRGNVYVVGESAGLDTNRDYATVKYDSNGNQIWVSHYDRGFSSDVARRVAVDKEGNVYVAGTTGANTGWATIKYDSEGGERWVATFDGQGRTAITTGIAVVASGNVYVTGWVGGGGTNADIVTIKYDTNGKMIWQKVFDESGDDYAYAMALDKWDNIYITGTCGQGESPGQSGSRYVTLKYDRDGNQKWVAYSFGPHRSSSHAIVLDNDDNVYVTGTITVVKLTTTMRLLNIRRDKNLLLLRNLSHPLSLQKSHHQKQLSPYYLPLQWHRYPQVLIQLQHMNLLPSRLLHSL